MLVARKMATVRLRAANSVLRNLIKANINRNVTPIRDENRILSGRFICFMTQSQSFTPLRNLTPLHIALRLEHTLVKPPEIGATGKTALEADTVSVASSSVDTTNVKAASDITNVTSNSLVAPPTNSPLSEPQLPNIPEPPVPLNFIDEPALESVGLGGWAPTGIIQNILHYFHVTFDMPWWACIVTCTLILRCLMTPLNIKAKRNLVIFQNKMPELQKLQEKFSNARRSGNYYDAALAGQQLSNFMQSGAPNPIKVLMQGIIQAPVFITVFFALKNMADNPEFISYQNGGLFWFTDLSMVDETYVLPLILSASIWATLKFGQSVTSVTSAYKISQRKINLIVQILFPTVVFLITRNFSSGILCYWITSNFYVLIQTFVLNFPRVKKYLKIPEAIPFDAGKVVASKERGVVESAKEYISNSRIANEISRREYINAKNFQNLKESSNKRTFKINPKNI